MTNRVLYILVFAGALLVATPVFGAGEGGEGTNVKATETHDTSGFVLFQDKGAGLWGATIGVGLIIIGGAAGLGRIGVGAAESMARQPEAAGSINGIAIVTAAMVEGATLIAVIACIMAIFRA